MSSDPTTDYDPTADYAAIADEFIAEHGTDALIEEMRAKVQNGGRTILGTTNTHVVLRHIDALADRVASLTAERDEAREERDVSRWSLLARAVRAETALRRWIEAAETNSEDGAPDYAYAALAVSSASEAETERGETGNVAENEATAGRAQKAAGSPLPNAPVELVSRSVSASEPVIAQVQMILRGDGSDRSDRDTLRALWKLLLPDECGLDGNEESAQAASGLSASGETEEKPAEPWYCRCDDRSGFSILRPASCRRCPRCGETAPWAGGSGE